MQITSNGHVMIANFPATGVWHKWTQGSHTVNVYGSDGREFDCYTFAWEKDRPSMLDFTSALLSHLEYQED